MKVKRKTQPRYLITPSLYDSWWWYVNADFKTKEEFMASLKREKTPPSDLMQKGIDFENDVESLCGGNLVQNRDIDYQDCVQEVADIVKGSSWQDKLSMKLEINGIDCLLYGRTDCMNAPWIYDIKWTKGYDIGKYKDKLQHLVYMKLANLPKFAYIICQNGKSVYREDYYWQPDSETRLMAELSEMVGFITKIPEFRDLYFENWESYS